MFGRSIWDKLPVCIFKNLEIFKNHEGDLFQKLQRTKHAITD